MVSPVLCPYSVPVYACWLEMVYFCSGHLIIITVNCLCMLCLHVAGDFTSTAQAGQLPPVLPNGAPKCAILECPNPCHIDESGKVHDCCGYTHAMEYQRRLAIQQRK